MNDIDSTRQNDQVSINLKTDQNSFLWFGTKRASNTGYASSTCNINSHLLKFYHTFKPNIKKLTSSLISASMSLVLLILIVGIIVIVIGFEGFKLFLWSFTNFTL